VRIFSNVEEAQAFHEVDSILEDNSSKNSMKSEDFAEGIEEQKEFKMNKPSSLKKTNRILQRSKSRHN
jgi:hypothetical protein